MGALKSADTSGATSDEVGTRGVCALGLTGGNCEGEVQDGSLDGVELGRADAMAGAAPGIHTSPAPTATGG
jgi:hypothetical protein